MIDNSTERTVIHLDTLGWCLYNSRMMCVYRVL